MWKSLKVVKGEYNDFFPSFSKTSNQTDFEDVI